MKKFCFTVFISLLLISSIRPLNAQTYWTLPDSNVIWGVAYALVYPPPWGYNYYYQYFITDDTLVNGIVYHRLEKADYDIFCKQNINYRMYAGAFRNDVPDKKVYYLPPDFDHDTLLDDFSLSIGDTLPPSYANIAYPNVYVIYIDSILINSNYHKRFMLAGSGMDTYLTEGVGNSTGPLEGMAYFEGGGWLY